MRHNTQNINPEQDSTTLGDSQMYSPLDFGHGKAGVHLPNLDKRRPVKKGASDLTATAAASDSDQQSTFTPPLSSSSSSSPELQLSQQAPRFDCGQHVKRPMRDPILGVLCGRGDYSPKGPTAAWLKPPQERLLGQQATQAMHDPFAVAQATESKSSELAIVSSGMDLLGLQPVVKLPPHSRSVAHGMESSQRNIPASFIPHSTTPNRTATSVYDVSSSFHRLNSIHQHTTPRWHYNQPNTSGLARGLVRGAQDDWTKWVELSLKVSGLPPNTTTRDLYRSFSQHGNVVLIELYENTRGERDGNACIRFRPPPIRRFWDIQRFPILIPEHGFAEVRLNLDHRRRTFLHPSPVNPHKKYPEAMIMHAESLDFGIMLDPTAMMTMCTSYPTSNIGITFRQDMLHREITVEFPMDIRDPRATRGDSRGPQVGRYNRTDLFRFRIPFTRLEKIHQVEIKGNEMVLVISLETPPSFYKRIDRDQSHDNFRLWQDNDAWYRQTDVVYAPNYLKEKPLTLRKLKPIIDLGRWTTYRFVFDMSKNDTSQFNSMREALRDYNVEFVPFPGFSISSHNRPSVWQFLESARRTTHGLDELLRDSVAPLEFEVRYQLEVCISHGYLNEYNLDQNFIRKLRDMGAAKARDLLEYVANHGKREFHAADLFEKRIGDGSLSRAKIPHYCVYIRSATVTPTTVHFQTPVAETSNRVIREFAAYADRFLRVRFTDEKSEGRIYSTDKNTMNEVFTRVKRVLKNGIVIGNRKFEYLASGNSQFREHGAYFFAPHPTLTTEKIRDWMGLFSEIRTVPLYASRLGQCFSTTRAIGGYNETPKELADIERNGFVFTDGVGKISPFLARLAAEELGILQHSPDPPSVFQIRLGGCKGILAISPTSKGRDIHIRRSQYKFGARQEVLEIIRWSQYACANLNRQLIVILSALGVPDDVFVHKLRLQLSKLERAMTDERTALSILQKDIDHNRMTLTVAGMILDGFQRSEEPFLMSLLQLWRAWCIKYLKEKARITISGGALLFGCVDETAILRGHFNDTPKPPTNASISEKAKYVPEVFVQLSKGANERPEVILGPMLLARNPSLHPGDIRVVVGVDVPELHHLQDVVVLPQTGDRDVASMCSGGDLDGDDFLVIWDQDLLPCEWNVEPMDYTRPYIPKHEDKIGVDDLTTFFVTYMKNDSLARIANAHLANADYLEEGVKDEKCLELASLHSMAVDYVKTGQPARMTPDLKPRKWPHFMEKQHVAADRVYTSRKVLGQLYDQVERIDFIPSYNLPFDKRILEAYELGADILESARNIKEEYDAHMRRIMAQHEIRTEFELWSTFILQHSRISNAFKFHEVIWELSVALKDQFRTLCRERAGGDDFECLGPFVAAMYKVTATEMANALQECHQSEDVGGHSKPLRDMTRDQMPMMSFPWLFPDVLGKIAKRRAHKVDEIIPVRGPAIPVAATAVMGLETAQSAMASGQPGRSRLAPILLTAGNDVKIAEWVTPRGAGLQHFEHHAVNGVSTEAVASSASLSGTEGSRTQIPRFFNNDASAGASSLLDLEDLPSLNTCSSDVSNRDGKSSAPLNRVESKSPCPTDAESQSDAESEEILIQFDTKPGLLDHLAALGASDP